MSTDLQHYSIDNQRDAIQRFADAAGYEIVATYEDAGRSGLNLEGRLGLQRLLADIEGRRADFDIVLVYDVSRWGRFQNIDESASYEYRCHLAGVRVEYCAEQFTNDGSIGSDVLKTLKRSMAAEHSRVLSVKVFAGQCRLVGLGYRQGGPAGYGLRRMLIDKSGTARGELARYEEKNLQTDRVVLVPGPPEEIKHVKRIYRAFVEEGLNEEEIAADLNRQGILTDFARAWTRASVHQILINEKYIGNNVWNRESFKLRRHRVRNDPDHWIRANGAFHAIVEPELFEKARTKIVERSKRLSDEEMLDAVSKLLKREGVLSGLVIDEAPDCPSSLAYQLRFGSLLRVYRLIGYSPERDFSYIAINRHLRAIHSDVVKDTIDEIAALGATAVLEESGLVRINSEFSLSIVIARCQITPAGSLRWKVRLERGLAPQITIAVRMNPNNELVRDYLILPTAEIQGDVIRTAETNGLFLDAFVFDTLAPLHALTERVPLKEVA